MEARFDHHIFPSYESQDSFSKYKPGSRLGKGAYGVVLNCTEVATNARFACKCVDVKALVKTRDGPNIERRLRNEISVMSYLVGHPNIVSLKDVYESGPNGQLFMVRACRGPGGAALQKIKIKQRLSGGPRARWHGRD